ncbi:MAG: aldo/keto reductase, partial [Actinomycetota bacterium]|nr:aldo/keto reductase [Actinomycetota bacterium]
MTTTSTVSASGTFSLGGDLPVTRLGFGAMRITGKGIWGPPADEDNALAVLRRAVELGVDFIDTAESYGPYVSEELIRKALHPYDGVVIATKGGLLRTGPDVWPVCGKPDYLRQGVEMSLRRLGVERIDLWQLHRIDPEVPAADQFGVMKDLQDEGKIRHLGLSEVSVDDIKAAREVIDVVSVQNLYNLGNRQSE